MKMGKSDKELIASDGRQSSFNVFCFNNVRRKRLKLMIILTLVAIGILLTMFGTYAVMNVWSNDPTPISTFGILDPQRSKRSANDIQKSSVMKIEKNMIKRDTDIESFLDRKYHEVNKNDASEELSVEENSFIQKRSSDDLKNSIRKLEKVIEVNDNFFKSLSGLTEDSEETAILIAKDINDIEQEILSLDSDIVGLLESASMTDNSIHKRVRHKRETQMFLSDIDPVAIELYAPILERKKREKRLSQEKLAEVRDEFIRCKKAASGEATSECDGVYHKVMDRFREITKKFKEIEAIVEEMEDFRPSNPRTNEDLERKKKKKKKDKKSSEESKESSEEKKNKKTSTIAPIISSTTVSDTTTEEATTIEVTTISDNDSDNLNPSPQFREQKYLAAFDGRGEEEEFFFSTTESEAKPQTCPAGAFNEEVKVRSKFQEDLDDHHSPSKIYDEHQTLDDIVRMRLERNQRRNFGEIITDEAQQSIDESVGAGKQKSSDTIGASGPFMTLCEQQMAKQKQNQPEQQPIHNNFNQFQIPLSNFANVHFPVTSETSKGSAKVMVNPGFSMMPYPVCFVNYPQQYRMQQQPFFYPGVIPVTQPGGKSGKIQQDSIDPEFVRSGGFFISSTGANLRPVQVPLATGAQPQSGYREAGDTNVGEHQPTYCTFLASDGANLPAHVTTEQPQTRKPAAAFGGNNEEEIFEGPQNREGDDRANNFNIPTQFDIIYATYPNQVFAMNQSHGRHHCDSGKLPCFNTNQCVPKSNWCDSKVDCLDASDETACSCKARLAENRICDGFIDCPMGSDELGCFGCDNFQFSCHRSRKEFEESGGSSNLMCFSSVEKCDGFSNCRNGKDETECSMIVRHVGGMLSYTVSSSEGILHRNFKGRWYPVCKNLNTWSVEACEMELGKLIQEPVISIQSVNVPGPFIQSGGNTNSNEPLFSDNCQINGNGMDKDENHVVFVKCPPPFCGTSKLNEVNLIEPIEPHQRSNDNSTRRKRDEEERIVGGIDAKSMEFPFIVAIFKDGSFHCGGSIYNEFWIITAAHCTRTFEMHYYEVRAGILRRSSYSPSAHISPVTHVIRHPDYETSTMKNDIALMKVKNHFSFNRWIRPICLPSPGKSSKGENWKSGPAPGTLCTTLGWGAIREKGPAPDDLKVVDVPILSKCKHSMDTEGDSICAGETFGTRDACQGDSGGPLVCKSMDNSLEYYLLGVVSHGEGCARANEPGVYTRVALYIDWIQENTNPKLPRTLLAPRHQCPGSTCVWGGNKCISRSQKCDGFVDCLGGEDEIECTMNWLDLLLGSNATEAQNSTTIDPVTVPENVDEGKNKTVKKKEIKEIFRCTNISQVINDDQRCDRIFDCEDGTDEDNCTCRDQLKFIAPMLICDGHVDCDDSSDEENCLKCNSTSFACPHSQVCIPKSLYCNGEIDCKFGEDELECIALTDGHSVSLDVNGKPFLHSKGIVTQNIQSTWKVICDDKDEFTKKSLEIANEVCNVIGFKSAKSAKPVEMIANVDITNSTVDIRHAMIKSKETVNIENCTALEIECLPFQSHSSAIGPIEHQKIKANSTKTHAHDGAEVIFVPINSTDSPHVIVQPINGTKVKHVANHLHDMKWSWNAEVFVNGELVSNGVLLDKSWVLLDSTALGNSQEPLHESYVAVLAGNTRSHLKIKSPYEQISKVDCVQYVNDSNVVLLHLEKPFDFNRHVLPSFLPIANETETDATCLAIALDSKHTTKTLGLKILRNCSSDLSLDCYQQAANETNNSKCDGEAIHQTALIVCKSKSSGWYPKAFHKLQKGFCDFVDPVTLKSLKDGNFYEQIQKIIDHPCEKCTHYASTIKCDTYRCPLGKCLKQHQLCDGQVDCHDGSDEGQKVCDKNSASKDQCSASEFRCRNGKCVEKTKFCDHIDHCGDKSDEPSECTCFSYLKATDPGKICDGIRHCWDRTDEDPTYCGTECSKISSFKCYGSVYCVPLEMVCDKRADCPNGADEEFCHGIYQKNDDFGEVMERSFGIWHTKCFPKDSPPTQEELEGLCKKLGFKDTTTAIGRVFNETKHETSAGRTNDDSIPVEFQMFNATKVVTVSKFSAVKLNDGFSVHLRPSKPLAKLVSWDISDHQNCHRMELKCNEEGKQ